MFTQRMKLADVIAANHNIILVLPRFGIPLGFGEKSVKEVCGMAGVPVEFMLMICNLYTFDDYIPDVETFASVDMSRLVPYLTASHHYYTHERLPHIGKHIKHIATGMEPKYGQILKQFYDDFRKEINNHFLCEERYDFPKLQALQKGDMVRSTKSHSEKSHGLLVDKLNDLTQIVYKYLPGNGLPEETMELVFDILQLSSDIQKHALVEEKILIPYMEWLERRER